MGRSVTVAEARAGLPGLIREVEAGDPITVSRRGKPVAVLVGAADYARLTSAIPSGPPGLWEFTQLWRDANPEALADDDPWRDVRDAGPARAVRPFEEDP